MGTRILTPPAALLTVDTVCAYVSERLGSLSGPLQPGSKLLAREVHGGNMNYAFEVRDSTGTSVFVKQAADFIKVLGPDAKLHRERLQLEVQVLEEMSAVLGDRASEFLPELYAFDRENMVFISEFLQPHRQLQESLYAGVASMEVAARLGSFLGLVHSRTHSSMVGPAEASRLSTEYANPALRDAKLEYVFSKAFREDDRAAHLRADAGFMSSVQELKGLYVGANKSNLALIHGDLHAGSVMADAATGSAKVIDPEFCVYGPPGMDVGFLISTYALACCQHAATGSGREGDLRAAIWQVWAAYEREMLAAGVPAAAVEATRRDTAGFAGIEIACTALGMAYERSLKLPDQSAKAELERQALAVGVASIVGSSRGVEALTDALERYGSY